MRKNDLFFSLILVPLDSIMISGAFLLAYLIRFQFEVTALPSVKDIGASEFTSEFIYLIPIWILIFTFLGLYKINIVGKRISTEAIKVFMAVSTSVLITVIVLFSVRETEFSRLLLIYMWFLAFLLVFLERIIMIFLQRLLYKRGIGIKKVILLKNGGGLEQRLQEQLKRPNTMGYKLAAEYPAIEMTSEKLAKVIKKEKPDLILQTDTKQSEEKSIALMKVCLDRGVEFTFVPNLLNIIQAKTELADFFSAPLFIVHGSPLEGWGRIAKRTTDIIGSLIAIILTSPFFIIVALAIKFGSKGSIIYIQDRIGRDGQTFPMYKFRSMIVDADQKADWTVKGDPRITPIGRFIRKTNLDEIPQFFNVLFGHMSLVGPRPEIPKYVKKYSNEIPQYFSRHRVKSGISGWAQINGERGDRSIDSRVDYDMYYVNNWSLSFDLKIIFITIWQILTNKTKGEI